MAINYWQKFESDITYHIYNRTLLGLNLFRNDEDYRAFLRKYIKYFSPYFDTYAYCLIPNHFHLLVKVKSETDIRSAIKKEDTRSAFKYLTDEIDLDKFIVDQFRRFLGSVSIKYNKKYKRRGPVLMKRFKRVSVHETKLNYMLCYIHHNPIHHKMRSSYASWSYSSYNAYLSANPTKVYRDEYLKDIRGLDKFKVMHDEFKTSKQEALNCD